MNAGVAAELSNLNGSEILVLLWHVHCNSASTSVKSMAEYCNISVRTARRALRTLEDRGMIWVCRSPGGQRLASGPFNRYEEALGGWQAPREKKPEPKPSNPGMIPCLYVSREAPEYAVKAVYKALVRQYHPDRAPAEKQEEYTERMKDITTAYGDWKRSRDP